MKTKQKIFPFIIVVVALIFSTIACSSSSNEGTIVATSDQPSGETNAQPTKKIISESTPAKEVSASKEIYNLGDVIEVSGQTIRMNSVKYQGSIIVANFTIENLGVNDLNVSSILSFSAKKEDGTQLEQEIFDCGNSSLDGTVLPGDKVRGDICWSGASAEDNIKIYYEASLIGEGAVVWLAIEGEAEPTTDDSNIGEVKEVNKIGDVVMVDNHTIRLNSLEYQSTKLVAEFTVENIGDADVDLSSLISFSAKTNEGIKLETEMFECGTSSIDGKVLPGDRLTGTICWSDANPEAGIRIYYEASLFGEGAVVWEAVAGRAESIVWEDAQFKVEVYSEGDLVQVGSHTIILNSAVISGGVLKANFTLENQGTSDLNVSSLMSFSARKRDGSSLEGEYFSCGSSLDGSVLPGDKLKGDVCWKGANIEDGINIYYVDNFLSEGAVVWAIK